MEFILNFNATNDSFLPLVSFVGTMEKYIEQEYIKLSEWEPFLYLPAKLNFLIETFHVDK